MTNMLTKIGLVLFIISSLLFFFSKWNSGNDSQTDTVYFKGDMSEVSVSVMSDHEMELNGWPSLKDHPYLKGIYLNNVGGVNYAFQEIRKDPVDLTTKVLYAQTLDDDPNISGTSRAQMSMVFKDGIDLHVYHTSHRMYLHPDLDYLRNYPSAITWFSLFEIWNKHNDEWSGDPAGSARWTLSIKKADGAPQALYWDMTAEYMQPDSIVFHRIWQYQNLEAEIPFGQWITLDVYLKRGDGLEGQLLVKVTKEQGPPITIFNISNTTIYPGKPEIQLSTWQPFKLYTSDKILDWMRSNNKSISAYYNDFTWYKN